jgi:hypothetical protein
MPEIRLSDMRGLSLAIDESDLVDVDNAQDQAQVIDAPTSTQTAAEERRRSERVEKRVPGWVSGADRNSRGQAITVCDMSMHGVGFYDATNRYRVGASHWMVVNGGALRVSTRVKIVSCRQGDEGGFYVGASFF